LIRSGSEKLHFAADMTSALAELDNALHIVGKAGGAK
jgi:hypothetical protein